MAFFLLIIIIQQCYLYSFTFQWPNILRLQITFLLVLWLFSCWYLVFEWKLTHVRLYHWIAPLSLCGSWQKLLGLPAAVPGWVLCIPLWNHAYLSKSSASMTCWLLSVSASFLSFCWLNKHSIQSKFSFSSLCQWYLLSCWYPPSLYRPCDLLTSLLSQSRAHS